MGSKRARLPAVIPAGVLKSERADVTLERLRIAQLEGHAALVVTNKSIPVLHLGHEKDLPDRWRLDDILRVPFSDMRTGKVSLLALRRDRRAIVLIQKGTKPNLALWPLDHDEASLGDTSTVPAINLEAENAALRRRLTKLEKRVQYLEEGLKIASVHFERLFRPLELPKPK